MNLLFIVSAAAHPARMVNATARIESDGAYRLVLNFDLPAYLLNETPLNATDLMMNGLLDGPPAELERELSAARDRLREDVAVQVDRSQQARIDEVVLPPLGRVLELARLSPRLPLMADVTIRGMLDRSVQAVSFRFPEVIGDVVLTVELPGEEPRVEPVPAGQFSSAIPAKIGAAAARPAASTLATSLQFLRWGFTHILPHGLDHILFVLGLFLLSKRLKPLLWQVTAFTLAHSCTLALSMLGWISLPAVIVEPLIAASIAFIAIENLFTQNLKPWRPFVVFGFGLVHGLGFAGVLREAELPTGQFFNAIVSFNAGVELGQAAVIALAILLVGWWRDRAWYRAAITVPASVLIALVALFWTVERIHFGG